jgi:hypothetical protein
MGGLKGEYSEESTKSRMAWPQFFIIVRNRDFHSSEKAMARRMARVKKAQAEE